MFNTEVIQIPVHFMSSVRSKLSTLMIQRVFRGFTVRKSVNKLSAIRNELREVESSINDTETVQLIRLDNKEWLRVNERIMLLLLKLDSVRGVGCGVRELRKAVIRHAISVQEKIDSIVDNNNNNNMTGYEIFGEVISEQVIDSLLINDAMNTIRSDIESDAKSEEVMEKVSFRDRFVDEVEVEIESEVKSEQVMDLILNVADMDTSRSDVTGSEIEMDIARGVSSEQIVDDSTSLPAGVESVMNATMEVVKEIGVYCDPVEGAGTESVMNVTAEVVKEIGVNCDSVEGEGTDDNNNKNKKRSMQLLEKLMDDNEKMMTMMSQMFERN